MIMMVNRSFVHSNLLALVSCRRHLFLLEILFHFSLSKQGFTRIFLTVIHLIQILVVLTGCVRCKPIISN